MSWLALCAAGDGGRARSRSIVRRSAGGTAAFDWLARGELIAGRGLLQIISDVTPVWPGVCASIALVPVLAACRGGCGYDDTKNIKLPSPWSAVIKPGPRNGMAGSGRASLAEIRRNYGTSINLA